MDTDFLGVQSGTLTTMSNVTEFYQQGAVFMHAVSLLGLAGLAVGISSFARRSRTMALACLGLGAACMLVGALGTYLGTQEARRAVETVSAAQRADALSAGVAAAMNLMLWAALMSALPLVTGLIAVVRSARGSVK